MARNSPVNSPEGQIQVGVVFFINLFNKQLLAPTIIGGNWYAGRIDKKVCLIKDLRTRVSKRPLWRRLSRCSVIPFLFHETQENYIFQLPNYSMGTMWLVLANEMLTDILKYSFVFIVHMSDHVMMWSHDHVVMNPHIWRYLDPWVID